MDSTVLSNGPEAEVSSTTDTIYNSVPTSTNDSVLTAEGNFGASPAMSNQDSATPADNTNMSATTTPDVIDDAHSSVTAPAITNPLAPLASDSIHMAKFKLAVLAALENTDFTGDIKKCDFSRPFPHFMT